VLHYFDDVSEVIPSADNEQYYDTSDYRIGMQQTASDKQLCHAGGSVKQIGLRNASVLGALINFSTLLNEAK
jgi:hypothetical protein